jgi:RHS repeat-associated protein
VRSYTYDGNGNILSKDDVKGTTVYSYDSMDRLISVTEPGVKATVYTYDPAGNRATESFSVNGNLAASVSYAYDERNRLTGMAETRGGASTSTSFTYDANGNTLTRKSKGGRVSYSYDVWNQMTEAKGAGQHVVSAYNPEGLRDLKSTGRPGAAGVTHYFHEHAQAVLELDGAGAETAHGVYGDGTLLARSAGGDILFYLHNGHGDVTALVDASGTVVASYYYDAFGNVMEENGPAAADNDRLYSGYQYDRQSGLYYLNARHYDPDLARFMNEDTYWGDPRDPLSLNLYTYGSNNPIRYWDPTGHYVSPTDKVNLSSSQIKQLEQITKDWNVANAAGNTAAMKAANDAANAIRASAGYFGGGNGNSIIVSSGNTTKTVVVNDTATVNNSGTIKTVNVLTGANSSITNSGKIGTINNNGTLNNIYNSGYNSGAIGSIYNNSSGTINYISNYSNGTIGTVSNSGSVGTINNYNTIDYISTVKNVTINNSGSMNNIITGVGTAAKVYNTGLINSIVVGKNGILDGNNTGFVEKVIKGSQSKSTNQWYNTSAETMLLMDNRFIQNYFLTSEDIKGMLAFQE